MSAALEAVGVPVSKVKFMEESSHHLTKPCLLDHLKLCTLVTQSNARETGEELSNTTMLSPLLCPGLQALDEEYLGADFHLGGVDQVDGTIS
jgi:tyrosyl-tRNA synthetase